MALNDLKQYSLETLNEKLSVVETNGPKIQKCLEYAMDKLTDYHNDGARGIIVDKAFFELYAKIESALDSYKKYNSRVTYNLKSQIDTLNTSMPDVPEEQQEIKVEKERSSIPRRSL